MLVIILSILIMASIYAPQLADFSISGDKKTFEDIVKGKVIQNKRLKFRDYSDLVVEDTLCMGNTIRLIINLDKSAWSLCSSTYNNGVIVNYIIFPTEIIIQTKELDSVAFSVACSIYKREYERILSNGIGSDISYTEYCNQIRNLKSKYYYIKEDSTSYIDAPKYRDLRTIYSSLGEIMRDSLCRKERFELAINQYAKSDLTNKYRYTAFTGVVIIAFLLIIISIVFLLLIRIRQLKQINHQIDLLSLTLAFQESVLKNTQSNLDVKTFCQVNHSKL